MCWWFVARFGCGGLVLFGGVCVLVGWLPLDLVCFCRSVCLIFRQFGFLFSFRFVPGYLLWFDVGFGVLWFS